MKKAGKKPVVIVISIVLLFAVLFGIWALLSPGTIRKYDGEKSLSEKFVMDINGAPNGFFINSMNTDTPVLLFVSSGPGNDDYVFTDKYKDMHLEDDFTVVYWDYRDMGIAYDPGFDTNEITLENIMSDTKAVTGYLKDRFAKDKIFIMGFSGGTDYNCPWELVKEYCEIIEAPDKGFYLIPDSAHSPLWENPGATCDILRQIKERCSNE